MKKHLVSLTLKENEKIKEIKRFLRLDNIDQVISYLINSFNIKEYIDKKGGK